MGGAICAGKMQSQVSHRLARMGNRHAGHKGRFDWKIALVALLSVVTIGGAIYALQPRGLSAEEYEAAKANTQRLIDESDARRAAALQAEWDAQTLQITRPENRPLSIALYGDSITVGWDAGTEQTTYREIVRSTLARSGDVDSEVQARAGATISEVFDSAKFVEDADVSIVALGLNDLWKQNVVPDSLQAYADGIRSIKEAAPDTGLICLGLFTQVSTGASAKIERGMSDACEAAGGKFVRLAEIYSLPGSHDDGVPSAFADKVSDGGHPTDTGMAAIAYRVLERLPNLAGDLTPPDGLTPKSPTAAAQRH